MSENPADVFAKLRALALNAKASDLGLDGMDATAAYGAVMDLNISGAHASIVGFVTGDASIYLSSGGGFIGGRPHASVSTAAKAFVEAASTLIARMQAVSAYPLPGAGAAYFYAITPGGVHFAEEQESEFNTNRSLFTPLYAAGQSIITAYRTLPRPAQN